MNLASDNKLRKIKDEYTVLSLLFGAKESNAEIYIWKLLGNTKHLGQVKIESIRKIRKDFCIVPADGQGRPVQDLMGSNGFIDIYIPDSATLLRCQIKQTDAPYRYYLQLPSFVAQVERRQSIRLNVHQSSEVKVSFGKTVSSPRPMSQHFLKDCFDISSGGFSIYVSKIESKFFELNDSIPVLELKAGKLTVRVSGQVVSIKEIEPDEHNGLNYKVWRISCKFSEMDQITRKYLEKFIFERIKDDLRAINE